ncbi:MAG: hypothetical protein ABR588_11480 [Sphingomicrobium sp.]|nr:hypothetical protein [Sphingomonadales bacterium]
MVDDKHPMQADGEQLRTKDDRLESVGKPATRPAAPGQTGESGGGPYPNPYTGQVSDPDGPDKFLGHGGQSEIEYHGPGEDGDEGGAKANAVTEED